MSLRFMSDLRGWQSELRKSRLLQNKEEISPSIHPEPGAKKFAEDMSLFLQKHPTHGSQREQQHNGGMVVRREYQFRDFTVIYNDTRNCRQAYRRTFER